MAHAAGGADEDRSMKLARPNDLLDHIGEELGVGDWHEIDQAIIDHFADVSEDQQWIHIDPERAAREMPGGKTIAHGFLVLSMFTDLEADFFHIDQMSHTINYGLDRLRFTAPVPVGARVRMRRSIADATRNDDGSVRVTFDDVIEIENNQRPAVVAQTIWLIHP